MEGHLANDYVIDKNGAWGSKSAALDWYRRELDAKQAKIDELMLEYCPDEMSEKQLEEWAKHQRVVYDGRLNLEKDIPVITALREALENPEGRGTSRYEGWVEVAEQAVEPEQEPVAKYMGHRLTPEGTKEFWGYADKPLPERTNLYAAPVRTKDLTDDEIDKLHSLDKFWDAHADDIFRYMDFARAVIAADREKNSGR